MHCVALLALAATASLSAALAVPRDGLQCAVCPKKLGPAADGSTLPLTGASAQLGAPTFCMYGTSFQYCFFGTDGGLSTSNNNMCPRNTTMAACPPHSN